VTDLSTTYLGLKLKNPLVVSSNPLTEKPETAKLLESAGAAALVAPSLFEEQVVRTSLELDYFLSKGTDSFAEALTFLPEVGRYSIGPEAYVDRIKALKKAVHIPVFGSLNGVSSGGWIDYAHKIEEAGADALELNLYYLPTNSDLTSINIEDNYVKLVSDIRRKVRIPIAIKLSPFFTSLPNLALRLVDAGANGLVLFNRFYQPDFDLKKLEVIPTLTLSNSNELRMPLHWIAILYGRIKADLALTSGVNMGEDIIKAMMAGANVAMLASAVLREGPVKVTSLINEVLEWMQVNDYESIEQMRGSMSQRNVTEPAAFERVNYIKVLNSYTMR
jgi:dihydroorotate dehydrogenase (fumarate)